MSPAPRQLNHGSTEPTVRVPPRNIPIRDLSHEGPERDPQRKPAPFSRLGFDRLGDAVRAVTRSLLDSLWDFGPTRTLILAGLANFSAAVILAGTGLGTLAAVPALLGFGLSLAALVYAGLPQIASRFSDLDRPRWFAMWALLTVLLAFLGFSSAAVIVVVLFVAGFTAAHVFWDLLIFIRKALKKRGDHACLIVTVRTASLKNLHFVRTYFSYFSISDSRMLRHRRYTETKCSRIETRRSEMGRRRCSRGDDR